MSGKTEQVPTTASNRLPDRNGGGTGNAGGTEVHAAAMVVAAVSMLRGTRLLWLEGVANDIPVAITAETGGPGDDIGLVLIGGETVEIQSKKGLRRGSDLWESLDALVIGVATAAIQFGVLAVTPDSSVTIWTDLAGDVIKIGDGAEDSLTEIGVAWRDRLEAAGRDPELCARIRIQALDLLQSRGADRRLAIDGLRVLCADPSQAEAAYTFMYRDAIATMRLRGRWTIPTLVALLRAHGIALREDATPGGDLTRLTRWALEAHARFSLPGARATIPITDMLPAQLMGAPRSPPEETDASAALERYHAGGTRAVGDRLFDGEWTGRFRKLNVVMSGPGLGKTTLATRIAWEHAMDGLPVLVVSLKRVSAALAEGTPFEQALELHGLSGSGLDRGKFHAANRQGFVIIADALDEAGRLHDEVAEGLVAYAKGHAEATIIVTTRPIGYETGRLASWHHYRLEAPDEKLGPQNLGRLVAASQDLPLDDPGSRVLAERELRRTVAADAIARSPLLLGMAATLIVRHMRLPPTRPALYEAMVALFEERDTETPDGPLSSAEASRVLDIVGWHLIENPLLTWERLRDVGTRQLAEDVDQKPLAVAALFERGFGHWERAGIVEKLHHAGTRLVTFVHKTFGEFAAARFLAAMDDRSAVTERIIDEPAWGEVVGFAGAIGMGNELAQLFVDRRAAGGSGQFERALELAGDRDAAVDDGKVQELAAIAFEIAGAGAEDRFAIGRKLATLAARRSAIVGVLAQTKLDDPDAGVRLIAWAAAVLAGPAYYDPARLGGELASFVPMAVLDQPTPRGGVLANPLGDHVSLIQEIALATLRSLPNEEKQTFADTVLAERPFTTWKFSNSVKAILEGAGADLTQLLLRRRSNHSIPLFSPANDEAWNRATNRIMHSIADSVAAAGGSDPRAEPKVRWPQFSALISLTGLWDSEAPDVRRWTKPFDQEAVGEAIRGLLAASKIDAVRLSIEAREVRERLEADPLNDLHNQFGSPDVPEPAWESVAGLPLERSKIETAFHHGSVWMLAIAANLLAVLPATAEDCERLLAQSEGLELFYASQVAHHHMPQDGWRDLLLARLEDGFSDGAGHLLTALSASTASLPDRTRGLIEAALRDDDPQVVEGGAKLGVAWLSAHDLLDVDLALEAFEKDLRKEASMKGSYYHTEYRAELVRLILKARAHDNSLLERLSTDGDEAVRKLAEGEMARSRGSRQV